jgi:hypothetical protein
MIEADLSGNQKEYILKLQFNWRWLITLDYVTLLIHKTKARIVGLLDYVQSSPSICGWIRPRAMLLTSQDPVDQKRRKPIHDWKQARLDVDVDVVKCFSHAGLRAVLAGKQVRGEGSIGWKYPAAIIKQLRQPAKGPKRESSRRMTGILKRTLRSHDRSGGFTCYLYFAMGAILALAV